MLRYEWKKVQHSPVALFTAAILIIFKLIVLTVQYTNVEFAAEDVLIDAQYNNLPLSEISQQLAIDSADADAALDQDVAAAYANGKISIDEYRLWLEGTEERYVNANALSKLKDRVSELMALNEIYENAQATQLSESDARYIAKWKPLRLLHEQAWNVMETLDALSFGGYWVFILVIPVFSELWDAGVDVLVRSSGNGWRNSYRAKRRLTVIAILAFWAIECFVDYGVPGLIWGYGGANTAIQSVRSCANIILPLSLYEYLVLCCLLRLCAYLTLYSVAVILCRLICSLNRAFVVCAGMYMLFDVLGLWNGSADKLTSPNSLFQLNTNPVEILTIVSGYCGVLFLLQQGTLLCGRLNEHGSEKRTIDIAERT